MIDSVWEQLCGHARQQHWHSACHSLGLRIRCQQAPAGPGVLKRNGNVIHTACMHLDRVSMTGWLCPGGAAHLLNEFSASATFDADRNGR
jgi:hypothetical protein